MFNICILDTDQSFLKTAETLILEYFDKTTTKIELFLTTDPALVLQKSTQFHLIFLDVHLGTCNGIEVGKNIRLHNKHVMLCFLTHDKEHALEAYTCHAFDYISKPITQHKLDVFFNDLLSYFPIVEESETKVFKTIDGIVKLTLKDILYFEYLNQGYQQPNRVVVIKTISKKFYVRQKISDMYAYVDSTHFYIPHKSFIINLNQVSQINRDTIIMTNGDILPISHRRLVETKKTYLTFLETNKKNI